MRDLSRTFWSNRNNDVIVRLLRICVECDATELQKKKLVEPELFDC